MRLIDLDPFWLLKDGRRVGFSFVSPADPTWRQIVTVEKLSTREQWELSAEARPGEKLNSQTGGFVWTVNGGAPIENASFDTLSVRPSVDGSSGGLWHGWITHGEIV